VRRDLVVDADSLATVGRICREVDGLPLAIELAAARAKVLALDDVAARLDDRLRFLRSWTRIADPRHQTLHATIDWSYELLSDDERSLLAQLSVFTGGFGLEAVAAVCLGGDEDAALELLGRLVDSSLVVAEGRPRLSRFRLLETIHEYAGARLGRDREAAAALRRSHAEYFLEVARRERADPWGPEVDAGADKHAVLARLDQERENLHAAVRWALGTESDLALPLCVALWRYWLIRGFRRQGLEWLERALELPSESPPPLRAMALGGAALFARLGGRLDRARELAEEGVSLARAVGPSPALSLSLNVLVTLAGLAGDYARARALSAESVATAKGSGARGMEAVALFILTEAALHAGRSADAADAGVRAVALARDVGDPEVLAISLGRLGMAEAAEGRLASARAQLGEALEYAAALDFGEVAAWCCEGLAVVAATGGDATRAARLLGAAETLRVVGGGTQLAAEAAARARARAAIGDRLDDLEVEAGLERGRRMTLDEVRDYALGVSV
jgi:non-specific serine/threonine protein kinase